MAALGYRPASYQGSARRTSGTSSSAVRVVAAGVKRASTVQPFDGQPFRLDPVPLALLHEGGGVEVKLVTVLGEQLLNEGQPISAVPLPHAVTVALGRSRGPGDGRAGLMGISTAPDRARVVLPTSALGSRWTCALTSERLRVGAASDAPWPGRLARSLGVPAAPWPRICRVGLLASASGRGPSIPSEHGPSLILTGAGGRRGRGVRRSVEPFAQRRTLMHYPMYPCFQAFSSPTFTSSS